MKKRCLLLGLCAAALLSFSINSSADDLYDYGFILSCGQTVYRSFDHQLSVNEISEGTDFFENTICGGTTPFNPGIE